MVISQREAGQVERRRTPRAGRRSCSSTGSGCCRAAGTTGPQFFEEAGYAAVTPDWPDDPETVEEARANPDVFAKKTLSRSPTTPPR